MNIMRDHFLLVIIIILLMVFDLTNTTYESYFKFSALGLQYSPRNNLDLIQIVNVSRCLLCVAACNLQSSCRTIDFDSASGQCRLFEGDLTTGSMISSASATSIVGNIQLDPKLFTKTHNQPCQACQINRYEVCSNSTGLCRCPQRAYWNGFACVPQLYFNQTCSQIDSCRSDFNLTCSMSCYGDFRSCITAPSSSMVTGVTVLGSCNGTAVTNTTTLSNPSGLFMTSNGTILVGDVNNLLSFSPGNRRANMITTYGNWPSYIYADATTSLIYATVTLLNVVHIWPTNATIPPNGTSGTCVLHQLQQPTGIVGDSSGNIYVASSGCSWVTKWAVNATTGTLVAGSGTGGSALAFPRALALDEARSFLYVCDQFNNRVQRFQLGVSLVGVTVAGGNGAGIAPNQLYRPFGLYLSRKDGALYISDLYNNRVQKWAANATSGSTIAGNANGTAGSRAFELNEPDAIVLDAAENYMYVVDGINDRIQRFALQ